MRKLLITLLLVLGTLFAQNPNTAAYPGSTAADTDLFVANNGHGGTTLNGSISNSVTSIVLTSGTNFVAPVIITIESEVIHCTTLTTNTLSGCTRGLEGTSAASHADTTRVYALNTAWYHNQVAAEVKALEGHFPSISGIRKANGSSADTVATSNTDYLPPTNPSLGVDSGPSALTQKYTNDTSTGTATSKLVKVSAADKVIKAATTDTDGMVGICVSGCTTSGSSEIAIAGTVACVFDGATTLGDWVTISSSTAGDCHDSGDIGASTPTTQVIGQVLTTNGAGGTYNVAIQLHAGRRTVTGTTNHVSVTNGDGVSGNPTLDLPTAAITVSCQAGLGDGLNAIAAGTYLESTCYNPFGVTWTITSIKCFTDNSGTSTLDVKNGAGTSLLTGTITCTSSFAAGTQSATTTIASADNLKFSFVADGTSKQTTWIVTGTR